MNKEVIIVEDSLIVIVIQVILIFLLITIITLFIRYNNALKLEAWAAAHAPRPARAVS